MAELESLETAAEHERILREIESTDTACIGPTLRYGARGDTHGAWGAPTGLGGGTPGCSPRGQVPPARGSRGMSPALEAV